MNKQELNQLILSSAAVNERVNTFKRINAIVEDNSIVEAYLIGYMIAVQDCCSIDDCLNPKILKYYGKK